MNSKIFRFSVLVFIMFVLCSFSSVSANSIKDNDKACLMLANEYISESDFVLVSTSSDLGNDYMYIGDSSYIYELDLSGCESIPNGIDVFNEVISLNVSNMGLSDISFIEALPNLMVVNASNNNLTSFPLVNDSVEEIYLENNSITDITNLFSILDSNPSFVFDIYGNKIGDIQYKQLVNNYAIAPFLAPNVDSVEINGIAYTEDIISYESDLEVVEITLDTSYVLDAIQVYRKGELVSEGSSSL